MNLNAYPAEKLLRANKPCKSMKTIVKPLRICCIRLGKIKDILMNENLNYEISTNKEHPGSQRLCFVCGFTLFRNIYRNGSYIIDPASLKANLMMTIDHRHFCICPECKTRNNVDIKKEGKLLGCIEDFDMD